MSNVYALSTARAGSKSVKNKNTMIIKGKPLYLHNVLESIATPEIKATYVTTDIPQIFEDAKTYNFKTIRRPADLCGDASTHTDTIYHGLMEIEHLENIQVDYLVVMLGNTMNMDRYVVSQAIDMLNYDPRLDAVITVIKMNHFNPIRAYTDDGNGYIKTFLPQSQIESTIARIDVSDKNASGDVVFQNGLWIIRRRAIVDAYLSKKGMLPFIWFGNTIKYIVQDPSLQEIDDAYQVKLLQ